MQMRVGFAQRDITPALGLPLGGYGARLGGADAVLDPLRCRTAVFDDGRTVVVVVVLDLVHVFGPWVARVRSAVHRRLGIAGERVLVAATHTHAGPGVFRSSIVANTEVSGYEERLLETVVACAGDAAAALDVAELRFGSTAVAGVAANRRDRALPVDEEVRALSAHRRDGEPLGVIANFACHPTVLSAANHAYSGDLFGVGAEQAAQLVGAPVLLLNGAAGDVSTRFTRQAQTHDEVQRMGQRLASGVERAVRGAVASAASGLAAAVQSVPVRWRTLPSPEAALAQVHAALAEVDRLKRSEAGAGALRVAQVRAEGAQAELWVSGQGGWEALFGARPAVAELQALRLGDVGVVAVPGELFSAPGAAVRRRLRGRALLAGYANDYLGYLIPEADAAEGGYEALMAMVDPACERAIRAGLAEVAARAGCAVAEAGSS